MLGWAGGWGLKLVLGLAGGRALGWAGWLGLGCGWAAWGMGAGLSAGPQGGGGWAKLGLEIDGLGGSTPAMTSNFYLFLF